MKEAFELIRKRMKEQTDFLSDCTKYGNKDAKQQEKSYSTMYMYEIADMVDDLIDVVSEVEAEYNKKFEPSLDCIEYGIDGFNLYLKEQYRKGYEDAKAEYGNGWIPVEKALPQEYCCCLVTRKKEYPDGSFDYSVRDDVWIELEGCWGWQSEFEGWIENIIAWQKLPEPYKPTTD